MVCGSSCLHTFFPLCCLCALPFNDRLLEDVELEGPSLHFLPNPPQRAVAMSYRGPHHNSCYDSPWRNLMPPTHCS